MSASPQNALAPAAAQRPRSAATAPPLTQERGGAAGAAAPIRLFVGGVAAVVTPPQLAERFAPFGQVTGVQLVAGKAPGAGAAKRARVSQDMR